jgi:hypothetical protein
MSQHCVSQHDPRCDIGCCCDNLCCDMVGGEGATLLLPTISIIRLESTAYECRNRLYRPLLKPSGLLSMSRHCQPCRSCPVRIPARRFRASIKREAAGCQLPAPIRGPGIAAWLGPLPTRCSPLNPVFCNIRWVNLLRTWLRNAKTATMGGPLGFLWACQDFGTSNPTKAFTNSSRK